MRMVLIKGVMKCAGLLRRLHRKLPWCSEIAYLCLTITCTLVVALLLHTNLHDFSGEAYPPHRRSLNQYIQESEEFIAPNDLLRQMALGVKTYNRPQCLLELIRTVRKFAPYLKIYVVDDSDEDAKALLTDEDHGDVYIEIPTDSGVGFGRNRIIEEIYKAGYEYLIMADDDYKLIDADTIPSMAKYMRDTDADVVAATRCDNTVDNCHRSKGLIVIDQTNHSMIVVPNITTYTGYHKAPTCYRSDLVQQFFMAKTEKLVNVHWDDALKNNDHYDFLLSAKLNNLKLVTCSDVQILHEKRCEYSSGHGATYQAQRERRWYDLLGYLFYKWSLDTIYDEVGKILTLNSTGHGVSILPNVTRFHTYSKESKYLVNQVVNTMNSGTAAWTWLRPLYTNRTWVMSTPINPCTHLVTGSLHAEYDRYITFKNEQSLKTFRTYLYNESCFFAESLWRVQSIGQISQKTHLYYVTAVADDNNYLKRLFHLLDSDMDKKYTTLIVVLMDKDSFDIIEANTKTVDLDIEIINQGPPFSRSIGLKVGFQKAVALASSRAQDKAIGFSIDTSIILPNDFSARIRRNTICGVSAFVPIVYKCKSCLDGKINDRRDGYWVNTGFGMVGLCLTDYALIGGWSTVYGYRWGGEDVDIMERIIAKIPNVIRTKEPDYIYVRSPSAKDKNPSYYMNKNLFPRPLPPSSLTYFIDDEDFKSRLVNFLRNQVRGISKGDLRVIQVTRTYSDNGHVSNYQIIINSSKAPADLLWFYVKSYLSPLI